MNGKSLFYVFVICLFAVPIFAMSDSRRVQQAEISVTGFVRIYGSEPHTWCGFVTEDGKEYALCGEAELLFELRKRQGIKIVVAGTIVPPGNKVVFQKLRDGAIKVKEFTRP